MNPQKKIPKIECDLNLLALETWMNVVCWPQFPANKDSTIGLSIDRTPSTPLHGSDWQSDIWTHLNWKGTGNGLGTWIRIAVFGNNYLKSTTDSRLITNEENAKNPWSWRNLVHLDSRGSGRHDFLHFRIIHFESFPLLMILGHFVWLEKRAGIFRNHVIVWIILNAKKTQKTWKNPTKLEYSTQKKLF